MAVINSISQSIENIDQGEVIIHPPGRGYHNTMKGQSVRHINYENNTKYLRRKQNDNDLVNSWNSYGEMDPMPLGDSNKDGGKTLLDQLIEIFESQFDFSHHNSDSQDMHYSYPKIFLRNADYSLEKLAFASFYL